MRHLNEKVFRMIAINFEAQVGVGIRQRVIYPALMLQEKPVLIVAHQQALLEINWPKVPEENKTTMTRFLLMMQSRSVPRELLIVIEEMNPQGWKRVSPWLQALDNEVWTINRRTG